MGTLLVAGTGGHLSELVRLRGRLPLAEPPTWVTFDSEQARTLLDGERVVYVHEVNPRGYAAIARNIPIARRLLRGHEFDRVISNGAGVALSFLPLARAYGSEAHFVECAARVRGPSVTGRLLSLVPGVRLYAQYEELARGRWRYAGSVFDAFEPVTTAAPSRPLRLVVTVGTMPFPFRRLVDRLAAILPDDVEVLAWQTGVTPLDGLAVDGRRMMPTRELVAALASADVVVSHAGVGSAVEALEAGLRPVLVPRLGRLGEHVDDHQEQVAAELSRRGLAIARAPEELTLADLVEAAGSGVRAARDLPPLALV
jgi:UDP-N-acetylglucosamine transferase subunit ALG13